MEIRFKPTMILLWDQTEKLGKEKLLEQQRWVEFLRDCGGKTFVVSTDILFEGAFNISIYAAPFGYISHHITNDMVAEVINDCRLYASICNSCRFTFMLEYHENDKCSYCGIGKLRKMNPKPVEW